MPRTLQREPTPSRQAVTGPSTPKTTCTRSPYSAAHRMLIGARQATGVNETTELTIPGFDYHRVQVADGVSSTPL